MDTKFSKQTRHELLEAPSAQVLPHLASQLAFSSIENAGMQQIIHWARQIERLIMSDSYGFERLLEAAGLINRHVDYPGKRQVVERLSRRSSRSNKLWGDQHRSGENSAGNPSGYQRSDSGLSLNFRRERYRFPGQDVPRAKSLGEFGHPIFLASANRAVLHELAHRASTRSASGRSWRTGRVRRESLPTDGACRARRGSPAHYPWRLP